MEPEAGARSSPGDEPAKRAASASGAGDGPAGTARAASSTPREGPSAGSVLLAAVATAVLGSTTLAVCEHALASIAFGSPDQGEPCPWDIVLAALGGIIITYLLFWTPVMVVCGGVCWLFARRRAQAATEPLLLALFVLLATLVVLPADLEMVHRLRAAVLIPSFIGGLGLTLAVYYLTRRIRRRVGVARFRRWLGVATGFAAIAVLVTGLCFVGSPLFNPGAYRVARRSTRATTQARPNVLWIVLDTVRADRLSLYGHDAPTSPFLEQWAQKSIVFNRVIADGMWTPPSHASMFTGLAARAHGVGNNTLRLDDCFRTASDVFGEHGYATGLFSNNPLVGPGTNLSKGFETCLVVYDFQRLTRFSLAFLCEKWGITPPLPWLDLDFGAALTNELVARWLDGHADVPVFVFINYMEAHLPRRIPREYREMFMSADQVHRSFDLRRRAYGELLNWLSVDALIDGYDHMPQFDRDVVKRQYEAAIRYLDDRVREMIDIFSDRGLGDNTLVVITSDHGEYLDTHGMWAHEYLTYQDVIHVLLLLRAPGRGAPQRVRTLVQLSDLYPTVLRAALGADAAQKGLNTRDLFEVAAKDGEYRIAVSECFGPKQSTAERLLAKNDAQLRHRATGQIAAVGSRFKLIRSRDGTRELYDLLNDPGELENLVARRRREARHLETYIDRWLAAVPVYRPERQPSRVEPDAQLLRMLRGLGYVADDE
jgi:arylsulfatase A-like enzyme